MSRNSAKQLTVRGIPGDVYRTLVREAKRERTSVNKLLLARLFPSPSRDTQGLAHDLTSLAGTWSDEQARDFETQLQSLRQIDTELWR